MATPASPASPAHAPPAPLPVSSLEPRPDAALAEDTSRAVFELQLEQTQLQAERLRALVIAIAATVYALNLTLVSYLYPGMDAELLGRNLRPTSIAFSAVLFAAYEFVLRAYLGCTLRSGRPLRREIRYLNALVETSTPTFVLWWLAQGLDPHQVLLTAVPYIYFLFILLSTLRMNMRLSIFTGAVAAAEYLTTAYLFRRHPPAVPLGMLLISWPPHLMKALFFVTGGFLAGFVGHQIRKGIAGTFRQLAERRQIIDLFGKHVSPAVVDKLLQQGADLGSEVRHVCVMFLDIRGFTRFSEQRSPEEVVRYLNTLFEDLIESINRHGGIVNKFLGDGFMAVFGAPIGDGLECKKAVACALEMVAQIKTLVDAGTIPPTRIGLHAGPAVTGNVGSTSRKEYTIIGDVVNLASRVESLNKDFGSTVLVTDAVWQAAGGALPHGVTRDLPQVVAQVAPQVALQVIDHGPVSVRGREAPVHLFQLA